MTEHKAHNASLPRALQHHVLDALAVTAVIPLGQVTGRVSARCRTTNLNVANTSAALEPCSTTEHTAAKLLTNICCQLLISPQLSKVRLEIQTATTTMIKWDFYGHLTEQDRPLYFHPVVSSILLSFLA